MKSKGMWGSGDKTLSGKVTDGRGELMYEFLGDWGSHIDVVNVQTKEIVNLVRLNP